MIAFDCGTGPVRRLAFSPDGALLASSAGDGLAHLWEVGGARWERKLDSACHAFSFHPNGATLAAGFDDGKVLFWNLDSGQVRETFFPQRAAVTGLAFADNGKKILVASGDPLRMQSEGSRLVLFPVPCPQQKPLATIEFGPLFGFAAVLKGKYAYITEERSKNRILRTGDIGKQDKFDFALRHPQPRAVALSEGGQMALACGWEIPVYAQSTRRERFLLKGHKGPVSDIAFTADDRCLLSGSWDGTVKLWDLETGAEKAAFAWSLGQISSVAVAPDGLRFACGSAGGTVLLWDAA